MSFWKDFTVSIATLSVSGDVVARLEAARVGKASPEKAKKGRREIVENLMIDQRVTLVNR